MPAATLYSMTAEGPRAIGSDELLGQGKVVLFAVPGAFTPTCSARHLPGFVAQAEALRAKGVERIVCLSVNDAFVMDAWGHDQNVGDAVVMVGDGNAEFTRAVGLDLDATSNGMGIRSQRYAMVIEDGVVKALRIDPPKTFQHSSAEAVLEML